MLQWLKQRSLRALIALIVIALVAGLAASFPPDLAFLMAVDLSTWVEAALAVYVAAQLTRVRPILAYVRTRFLRRFRISPRQRRTRAVAKAREPSNDDDPAPGLRVAA